MIVSAGNCGPADWKRAVGFILRLRLRVQHGAGRLPGTARQDVDRRLRVADRDYIQPHRAAGDHRVQRTRDPRHTGPPSSRRWAEKDAWRWRQGPGGLQDVHHSDAALNLLLLRGHHPAHDLRLYHTPEFPTWRPIHDWRTGMRLLDPGTRPQRIRT